MAKNDEALGAYLAHVEGIRAKARALLDAAEDHFGTAPDDITWAHVGSLAHAEEGLGEVLEFLNLKA